MNSCMPSMVQISQILVAASSFANVCNHLFPSWYRTGYHSCTTLCRCATDGEASSSAKKIESCPLRPNLMFSRTWCFSVERRCHMISRLIEYWILLLWERGERGVYHSWWSVRTRSNRTPEGKLLFLNLRTDNADENLTWLIEFAGGKSIMEVRNSMYSLRTWLHLLPLPLRETKDIASCLWLYKRVTIGVLHDPSTWLFCVGHLYQSLYSIALCSKCLEFCSLQQIQKANC